MNPSLKSDESHWGSLVIRADGSTKIGGGHLLRCLALAEKWRDRGGQVHLVTAKDGASFFSRFSREKIVIHTIDRIHPHIEDLGRTLDILSAIRARDKGHRNLWVVLDGYHFDSRYLRTIHEAGYFLLILDDMIKLPMYTCDLILNPNLKMGQDGYPCIPETRILSGPKYRLLRKEFFALNEWRKEIPDVARNVLVTVGAADSRNMTLKAVKALLGLGIDGLNVKVVIGEANPHKESLKSVIYQRQSDFELLMDVTEIASVMLWADLAISGAGGTSWEMAFMGLPNLMIVLAENQWPVAKELSRIGCSILLGQWKELQTESMGKVISDVIYDKKRRTDMSTTGRSLVDGMGTDRVVDEMASFYSFSERERL